MFPILEVDTTELPYVPPFLKRYAYWCFFIEADNYAHSTREGSLVVRRYRRGTELEPLPVPRGVSRKRLGFQFREVLDFPSLSALRNLFGGTADDAELVALSEELVCHSGVKLGGWPYTVQGAAFLETEDPDYEIQLDNTDLYMYADCGIGHVYGQLEYITWETM